MNNSGRFLPASNVGQRRQQPLGQRRQQQPYNKSPAAGNAEFGNSGVQSTTPIELRCKALISVPIVDGVFASTILQLKSNGPGEPILKQDPEPMQLSNQQIPFLGSCAETAQPQIQEKKASEIVSSKEEEKSVLNVAAPMDTTDSTVDGAIEKKPFWSKINKVKIPKAEKIRRLNRRMKKVLRPKNALMVINEIVGNVIYNVEEVPLNQQRVDDPPGFNFKTTCNIDGEVHQGFGKSKTASKTAAAESAFQHLCSKKLASISSSEDVKMEDDKDDFSYSHLASFALYKLLSSWDESGNILTRPSSSAASLTEVEETITELLPSKKIPENAHLMNPVMLVNQMFPGTVYSDCGKVGIPPKIMFDIKCTINGKDFLGNGPNKKAARRDSAFKVCKELLNIQYPEEKE